ncbi:hypothetical protein WA026_009563 [Henosepilachna vigintioctopunctata]|uniref:Something about silencing protein 10 n=1 Tax=Henosepilachna vigintioctopunctata TaxID=420089 RepID=A0AAW1TZS1_9CUCU
MSDYEPTDSESDYEENEKILLQNVRRGNRGKYDSTDESEQEVFNVRPDEDDSDDDEDEMELADSDIEGQEDEDDLPNENAWGKKRRNYYSTDFIDPDYGELDEKNARRAELEEEEASRLYLKFSGTVDNDDFYFDASKKDPTEKVDNLVDKKMNTDTSKLNEREKRNLLKSENPEFIGIMEDFKYKMEIQKNFLEPVLNKYRLGQIPKSSGLEFVQTFDRLISNYFVNITAYLLLKADKTNLNNHPIIKRLIQYRDRLQKLCEIFDEVMKEKIQNLIKEVCNFEILM